MALSMLLREIKELVVSTSDPSFAVDGSGRVAAWNGAAEAMFALAAADAIGRQCDEVIRGADECGPVCSARCTIQQAVRERRPVGNFDLQVLTADGMQWCNVSVLVAQEENSTTPCSIHVLRQIDVGKRFELLLRDFVVRGTGMSASQASTLLSSARACARDTKLSTRERDVLKLLARGLTTAAMAEELHISRTTVSNHVQHVLHKLDAHSRLEAIRRAEHAGLI